MKTTTATAPVLVLDPPAIMDHAARQRLIRAPLTSGVLAERRHPGKAIAGCVKIDGRHTEPLQGGRGRHYRKLVAGD